MSLSVTAWSFFIWRSFFATNYDDGLLFSRLCNVTASFIPVFFTHFSLAITYQEIKNNLLLKLGYANIILITILGFTPYFETVRSISIFKYYADPGPLFHYYLFHFIFYSIYSEYLLFKNLKHLSADKKNQIKYIIVATVIGFITGDAAFLLVYKIPINPTTLHFVWIYVAIISYAIVKHRLMDINILVRQGLIYSFLIGVITTFYFFLVYSVGTLFQNYMGYKSLPFTILLFTVIALFFKPIERKIQELVDLLIFKKTAEMLKKENQKLTAEIRGKDQMRAVSTLAAGMAHEIKNPLTAIKTFTEHLTKKHHDPEFIKQFISIVGAEVDRIDGTVRQLLEFSKPSPLQLEKVELHKLIDETLNFLNGELVKYDIHLEKSYIASNSLLSGDKKQLRQILLNLFLNSIQAMPNGGALSITTKNNSNLLEISIADTGNGIPRENLKYIFEPFFTTKDGGTGLGLSIVHGIIEEHGGKITASNAPEKGAIFTLAFKTTL